MDNKNTAISSAQWAGGSVLMWISSLDLASWSYLIGMFVAVCGLLGGFIWQWRRDQRERAIAAATLEALKKGSISVNGSEELE